MDNKTEEASLYGHTAPVKSVNFSGYGGLILSGSYDCALMVWNVQKRSREAIMTGRFEATSICLNEDARLIVTGHLYNSVRVWSLSKLQMLLLLVI